MGTTAETIGTIAEGLGIAISTEFVPWSKSRSAKEKDPSLNWKVKLFKDGKEFLTTGYMAGCAHCPSYERYQERKTIANWEIVKAECEYGKECVYSDGQNRGMPKYGAKPILPKLADVLASLVMDSDAIDYPTFEDWAESTGYDADSRKAEAIYRACLEIGLKLRSALGEDGLKKLQESCQDY